MGFAVKTIKNLLSFALLFSILVLTGCGGGGGSDGGSSSTDSSGGSSTSGVDLSISSLNIPSTANAGDVITVDFTVVNTGSEMAGWFSNGVYLSTDNVIDSNDQRKANGTVTYLNPGVSQSFSKTVTIPANLRSGTFYVGVLADYNLAITESNESNNLSIASIVVTGTTCSIDSHEENDTAVTAGTLSISVPQTHNHCEDDVDWFTFSADAGATYSLTTDALGTNADTRIELYDTDGITFIKGDSDSGMITNTSRLSWTAPTTGNYFVKVKPQYWLSGSGANTDYRLTLGDATIDVGFLSASLNGSSSILAGGLRWIWVELYNNGFTSSGSFKVNAVLSTDNIIDNQDVVVASYTISDLAAVATSELFNLDVAIPKETAAGSYYLAFIADADNVVAEINELNNQSELISITVSAPTCTIDNYEDDDFIENANAAIYGEVRDHNFCDDDKDWISFPVVQGNSYVVDTIDLGATAMANVYDDNGVWVAGSDNYGSKVTFIANSTGTYSVKSSLLYAANIGANKDYRLVVYEDLPDLNVDYLSYDFQTFYPGGQINVWPRTRNSGFEDAVATETALYLSTDATIDGSDIYLGSRSNTGLASFTSDEGWSLVPIPDTVAPGDYYLGAIADNTDQVLEIYEDNNTFSSTGLVTIATPVCAADLFEQDDYIQDAVLTTLGSTQSKNFCDDINDWIKLDATQGDSYVFELSLSLKLNLFDTDQTTQLEPTASGFLHWVAPATGMYYLQTTGAQGSNPGSGIDYTLDVYSCDNDAYEDDDVLDISSPSIAVGDLQIRNFCDGSNDSASFNATAGTTYTISTSALGVNADTHLYLYDDSLTSLANNDNAKPNVLNSEIVWTAPANGTYYIRVFNSGRGADTGYTLNLQ